MKAKQIGGKLKMEACRLQKPVRDARNLVAAEEAERRSLTSSAKAESAGSDTTVTDGRDALEKAARAALIKGSATSEMTTAERMKLAKDQIAADKARYEALARKDEVGDVSD